MSSACPLAACIIDEKQEAFSWHKKPKLGSSGNMAMKTFAFKKYLVLHHICSRNLGKCILLSCLSNKKCIYMPFPNITFNTLISCAKKEFISEKVLDARPNRFIMAIFVNTLGQRWTKWNFTKWAIKRKTWTWLEFIANGGNCTQSPFLTPPPHTHTQLSCYKTRQVSRNQGHKQLLQNMKYEWLTCCDDR